jgi:flagellar biosynthesis protein
MSETPSKPPNRAVALRYDPATMPSPEVVATGRGELAERILALARQHGVPIRHDPDLVGLLAVLDVGSQIPPELYQAVAEVLAFVYHLNNSQRPAR